MVLSLERWVGKIAIITGASSVIGLSVAENLATSGVHVVAFAKSVREIEELAKTLPKESGNIYAIRCDRAEEIDILLAFDWIRQNLGHASILINISGIFGNTNLIEGDLGMWRKILDTNVIGQCLCTKEVIKGMIANNIYGHIININNIISSNLYQAPKLEEHLRKELSDLKLKVKVTSINSGEVRGEHAKDNTFKSILEGSPVLEPKDIVDAVMYVLSTPSYVEITDLRIGSQRI